MMEQDRRMLGHLQPDLTAPDQLEVLLADAPLFEQQVAHLPFLVLVIHG
jgi:hypothetical protein